MDRRSVITSLKALRTEAQQDANIMDMEVPFALILSDVCDALGLSPIERGVVLGPTVALAVREWESAKLWQPTEEEEETATVPFTEVAAVPVAMGSDATPTL